MADIDLLQAEADALIAMEKHRIDDTWREFPGPGGWLAIPLTSSDKRENFMLDVTRSQLKLTKATYQNRARQVVILMRLDLDGPRTETLMGRKFRARICTSTGKAMLTNGRLRPQLVNIQTHKICLRHSRRSCNTATSRERLEFNGYCSDDRRRNRKASG
jgi:hypothetical protein